MLMDPLPPGGLSAMDSQYHTNGLHNHHIQHHVQAEQDPNDMQDSDRSEVIL